jgi:hypothetical protein
MTFGPSKVHLHREGRELARQFIAETCAREQIVPVNSTSTRIGEPP